VAALCKGPSAGIDINPQQAQGLYEYCQTEPRKKLGQLLGQKDLDFFRELAPAIFFRVRKLSRLNRTVYFFFLYFFFI
jgi:hypothetical protein